MNTTVQMNHSALQNCRERLPVGRKIFYLHWHENYERLKEKVICLTTKEKPGNQIGTFCKLKKNGKENQLCNFFEFHFCFLFINLWPFWSAWDKIKSAVYKLFSSFNNIGGIYIKIKYVKNELSEDSA